MDIVPGKLYGLRGNSPTISVYQYSQNNSGNWTAILKSNRLVSIDLSDYLNKTILCVAKIQSNFGIFLVEYNTVGIGIQNLRSHE